MTKAYLRALVRQGGKGSLGVGLEVFRLDAEEVELTESEAEESDDADGSTTAIMRIYENIGEDFWTGGGITAKKFANELDELGTIKRLNLHINCLGGDCHTAQAIHSIVSDYDCKKKTSYIDGVCASAATLIASAADEVVARHNTNYMIHYPWSFCVGNAEAMSKAAEDLEKLTIPIVSVYKNQVKGKIDEKEIRALMQAETWMTADEALEYGFVDKVRGKINTIAKASKTTIYCSGQIMNFAKYKYHNFPDFEFDPNINTKQKAKMAQPNTPPNVIDKAWLITNHPNLATELDTESRTNERKRIADLDAMMAPGLEKLIADAKADGRTPDAIAMESLGIIRGQLTSQGKVGQLKQDSAPAGTVPAGDAPNKKPDDRLTKATQLLTSAQEVVSKRRQNNGYQNQPAKQ